LDENGKRRRVILCEGSSDKTFFQQLIRERSLPHFTITYPNEQKRGEPGGWTAFHSSLAAIRTERWFPEVAGIIIVRDNDENPNQSFDEVCNQIRLAGKFGIPGQPLQPALSVAGAPVIVVMTIPWAGESGNIETLCIQSMADAHQHLKVCVDDYATCAGNTSWPVTKRSKMLLRSMIAAACKSDPNTGLEYAWSRDEVLVPLNHSCFDRIADFLISFDTFVEAAIPKP
jgi:hypothetical protein